MAKFKLNYSQLPIKAHFFFFMAAMGPILPFLPVYGKQLGVSPLVMGSITAVLPLLFLISKPSFGLLVDHFRPWRKTIFMALLATTSAAYIFLYFLPPLPGPVLPEDGFRQVSCSTIDTCQFNQKIEKHETCSSGRTTNCLWQCSNGLNSTQSIYFRESHKGKLSRDSACLSMSKSYADDHGENKFADSKNSSDFKNETNIFCGISDSANVCNVTCKDFETPDYCLYTSFTFWAFVLLMSVGNIGFNVSNCISDAICFDVLGDSGQMGYGRQRVWGTIGFGITALVSGYAVDAWSQGTIKIYTPAFILVFIFTIIDLFCCSKLELPKMSGSENIVKDVYKLLRLKPIAIFLFFATIAGIMDSFIIYFLFWHIEDLAATTGDMGQIKFIEGSIIAAETLGGEVIFFSLAGKILKKIGYGYSFVFCFFCYSLRMLLISLAPTPWWIFSIELFMQGPSYALCYTTIVAYASVISPPGASATVQGIVAGMDDGLGFALGSLIGGILYKRVGGSRTLQIYSVLAAASSVAYFLLHVLYLKHVTPKTDNRGNIEYKSPRDAASIDQVGGKELQVL
ncbi:major facilitator superfamily domain-containing protein 6 [Athalia rosae]|uniref:major facilitator superfamily domain-containing protein 6 n=1 Tax=Athalia rosae TaxID=37344 RepID=UPI002033D3BA|nr:major facilitator superfamily domain-containing protein 6 [Athalia rosae]XP_048511890.1 major facilitator superfamily domain-containing protein 6 [Athalia rosae]